MGSSTIKGKREQEKEEDILNKDIDPQIISPSDSKINIRYEQNTNLTDNNCFTSVQGRQTKLDSVVKNLKPIKDDGPQEECLDSSRHPISRRQNTSRKMNTILEKEQIPIQEENKEDITNENQLLGNQYFEDSLTLLGSNKLIQSFLNQTVVLKDLNQSSYYEQSQKQFIHQASSKSLKAYNDAMLGSEIIEAESDEEDDEVKRAPYSKQNFSAYSMFDWKDINFNTKQTKDNQTLFNIVNSVACTQINYKGFQEQLLYRAKNDAKKKKQKVLHSSKSDLLQQ